MELRFTPEVKSDKGWFKLNNGFPIPESNSYDFVYDGKSMRIKLIVEEIK